MSDSKLTLIHYGELSLKGRNRAEFELKLVENIERTASGSVTRYRGYFVMEGGNPELLVKVPGISWFAETYVADKELNSIIDAVTAVITKMIQPGKKTSFGVFARRPDKKFPLNSMELASIVGDRIVEKFGLKADLRTPDLRVFIEVADRAYIFFEKKEGLRGFPTDVSGRVLSLISGGIDSPVSSYLMMKRGCRVDLLHFHVYADNRMVENTKMTKIFSRLNEYQHGTRIFIVPYYAFESAVLRISDMTGYELVTFRRFMIRVAERIARKYGILALVTGDSLGQVASQTIENIAIVSDAVTLPIFQPLITYDKQEIIDLARKIGTYEMSIETYKDCCSIVSANPRTRARLDRVMEMERRMKIGDVIEETLSLITEYEL